MSETGKLCLLPMAERHLKDAAALERLCFSEPWSRDAFLQELQNPLAHFLVAERGGVLAGYAGMTWVLDEGYIDNIAVSPVHRRQGVGRALVGALDAFARGKRLSFLSLEVRVSNKPAVTLYQSCGFRSVGVRPNFYSCPSEDAYIMTKYFTSPQ